MEIIKSGMSKIPEALNSALRYIKKAPPLHMAEYVGMDMERISKHGNMEIYENFSFKELNHRKHFSEFKAGMQPFYLGKFTTNLPVSWTC